MFLIDDLITAPAKGLMFIARRVRDAVEEEISDREEALKSELHDQYMLLELGEITEEEFDEREEEILDQLDALESAKEELYAPSNTSSPPSESRTRDDDLSDESDVFEDDTDGGA